DARRPRAQRQAPDRRLLGRGHSRARLQADRAVGGRRLGAHRHADREFPRAGRLALPRDVARRWRLRLRGGADRDVDLPGDGRAGGGPDERACRQGETTQGDAAMTLAVVLGLTEIAAGIVTLWSAMRVTTAAGFATTQARWAFCRRLIYGSTSI